VRTRKPIDKLVLERLRISAEVCSGGKRIS